MNQDITRLEAQIRDYVSRSEPGKPAKVTLTWAQSIDGCISAGRGQRTKLSGSHSHKMTHYLRTLHDAILVGKGTVVADNPKLNCRYPDSMHSPRPIILDSHLEWEAEKGVWAVLEGAKKGTGAAPWVLCTTKLHNSARVAAIERVGGRVAVLASLEWPAILEFLGKNQIANVMVEGGAQIIATALQAQVTNCVIVTVAPVWLGKDGVWATPNGRIDSTDVAWWSAPSTNDTVLLCRA